ncbi:MAG: hypothetical protein AAGD05_06900, partial [Bacteroidota bacterium]
MYGECQDGGGVETILGVLDCALSGGLNDPENRWRLFRSMYLGVKQKLRRDLLSGLDGNTGWCRTPINGENNPLYSAACSAIIPSGDIYSINPPHENGGGTGETETQLNNYVNGTVDIGCTEICEMRVEEWVRTIRLSCPLIEDDDPDLVTLRGLLSVHCNLYCDDQNPMAYLLSEQSNSLASSIANLLSASCPDIATIVADELLVDFDDVYSLALDENGDPICSVGVNSCLNQVLSVLSNEVFPLSTCSNYVYDSPNNECFTQVTVDVTGAQSIRIAGSTGSLSGCGSNLFLTIEEVDLCQVVAIRHPELMIDNTLWATFELDDGTFVKFEIAVCNSPGSFGFSPCTVVSGSCFESCLVVPNDILIVDSDEVAAECINQLQAEAELIRQQNWEEAVNEVIESALSQRTCLDNVEEIFEVSYQTREHHYTLYYYDQAGNLVQTIPPEGVNPVSSDHFPDGQWDGTPVTHSQATQYQYNSLGQVLWQESSDGGATRFKYDYAQRLRFSENAKQAAKGKYSFTKYDGEGRITRVGEVKVGQNGNTPTFAGLSTAQIDGLDFPQEDGSITLEEVTKTYYNAPPTVVGQFPQTHLRGRVAMTSNESIETRYSYDAHGNVEALQHELSDLEGLTQRVYYDYDLISGNVLQVAYQPGRVDAFYHRYDYDADNRLTKVWTSEDGVLYDQDARYYYYLHGPLARIELGDDQVQGLDYYYTLQGWIKGVNIAGTDTEEYELGADGGTNGLNRWSARDEMSYALGYHDLDYKPIGNGVNLGGTSSSIWTDLGGALLNGTGPKGLFNGNISWMVTDIPHFDDQANELGSGPQRGLRAQAYQYDQLHRIKKATSFGVGSVLGGGQVSWTQDDFYNTAYRYDPNGNLLRLDRWMPLNGGSVQIDALEYVYSDQNRPNLLYVVKDTDPGIPNDPSFKGQPPLNYSYDEIGNLIGDKVEGVDTIEWTVYGKV